MMAGPQQRDDGSHFGNNSTQNLISNLSRVTSGASLTPIARGASTGGFRVASGSHPLHPTAKAEAPESSAATMQTNDAHTRKAASLSQIQLPPGKRPRHDPSPTERRAFAVETSRKTPPRSPFPGSSLRGEGHVPGKQAAGSPPRQIGLGQQQRSVMMEGLRPQGKAAAAPLLQMDSTTTSRASELTMENVRVLANAVMNAQGGDSGSNMQAWVAAMADALQRVQHQGGDLNQEGVLAAITSLGSVTSQQAMRPSPPSPPGAEIASPGDRSPQRWPGSQRREEAPDAAAMGELRRRRVQESMEEVMRNARRVGQAPVPRQQQVPSDPARMKPLARAATGPEMKLSSKPSDSLASKSSSKATNYRVYSNDFHSRASSQQQGHNEEAGPAAEAPRQLHAVSDPNSGPKFLLPNKQVGNPWEGPGTASPIAGHQSVKSAERMPASRPKSRDAPPRLPTAEGHAIGRPRSDRSDRSSSLEHAATPIASNPNAAPFASSAVANQAEQMAAWLRQQYSTLGQAMSMSEAHINRISTQASSNLPHVLARLQAAQQAAGVAAAQGGLPAAAALMHLQGLMHSIGSAMAVSHPGAPPAAQLANPFPPGSQPGSMDLWRDSYAQQINVQVSSALLSAGFAANADLGSHASTTPLKWAGQWEALMKGGHAADPAVLASLTAQQRKVLEAQWGAPDGLLLGLLSHRDSSQPSPAGESLRRMLKGSIRDAEQVPARDVRAQMPSSPPQDFYRHTMPDVHNPFEMQRLAMARGEAPPAPPPALASLPLALHEGPPLRPRKSKTPPPPDSRPIQDEPFKGHRSAPPLSVGVGAASTTRVSVVGIGSGGSGGPTAATVKREAVVEQANQPEDDRQAAETLLSLFGIIEEERRSASPDLADIAPKAGKGTFVRRPRTQRAPPIPFQDGGVSKQHPVLGTVVPHAPRTLAGSRNNAYHSDSSGKYDPSSSDSLKNDSNWRSHSPVSGRAKRGRVRGRGRGRGGGARAAKDEDEWVPRRVSKGVQKKELTAEPEISDEDDGTLARPHDDSEVTQSA